jgi:signal transduction histidine kinase
MSAVDGDLRPRRSTALTALMLEPLDPVHGVPAEGDTRVPGPALVAQPQAAAGLVDRGRAPAEVRPERADAAWSNDWLQLSHELRTPLNAILGNVELLLDGSAGPMAAPARACVGDIQVASRQLLRQLQPLLLLIQARTSEPLTTGLPLDLLGLIRRAASQVAAEPEPRRAQGRAAAAWAAAPCLPDGTCLMLPGDPVWLGALAATLVELHAAARGAEGPLTIDLEQPDGGEGVVLRAFWPGLDPAATSPLPLALIDAVLALHGGRIGSLAADGLRLDLPGAALVPSSGAGPAHP